MAYSSCLDVDKLDPTIFNDVCVASDFLGNETAWTITQSVLKTCCGANDFFITDDDCYTYCNITTPLDSTMLNNCLFDTMDQDTQFLLQYDCYPLGAWDQVSTTDTTPGLIATTWTYPDQTVTETESGGVVTTETFNYWNSLLTAPATTTSAKTGATVTGSAATKTTGSKSTSSTASPTSSTKSSGASRLSYGTGTLVGLFLLAIVL